MCAPTPLPDLRPLSFLAGELDSRAVALRLRAATVGFSPQAAGWSSPGARAFARSIEDSSAALLVVASRLAAAAEELRALATTIAARAGCR